ncbi:MAG: DUF4270 domain-containing protein [Flavobacteriaceae bacterium]
MTKRMMSLRSIVLLGVAIFSLVACEEDFQDIGVGIVDNDSFDTDSYTSAVEAYTVDVEKLNASGLQLTNSSLGQYLLGIYNTDNFGKIEGNLISQLGLPVNAERVAVDYGADTIVVSTIDTVILSIPFQYSLDGTYDGGAPKYSIDSIIGNQDESFSLKAYRLDTYLNYFDPSNPLEVNTYYSNRDYDYSDVLNAFPNELYKFNTLDTLTVVKRYTDDGYLYDRDTLELEDGPQPKIKLAMNEEYFRTNFLEKLDDPEFDTQDAFQDYFRGVFLESTGDDGALLSMSFGGASISMYYTNTAMVESTGVGVDTIKKSFDFPLTGIRANQYKRSGSKTQNADNLYVQGAAGNEVRVDLFGADNDGNGTPDELEELRTKDWIINEASLSFYVDENEFDVEQDSIPYRMFIYALDDEGRGIQTIDMMQEGEQALDGWLERDSVNDFWRYKLRITHYVANLLDQDPATELNTLGVKIISTTDYPSTLADTIIQPYNWTGKGVVLHGPKSNSEDKKLELKIFYSELNQEE